MRRRLLADLDAVERGRDPKGVFRDPAANHAIALPVAERARLLTPVSRQDKGPRANAPRRFIFQAGQPDDVRRAYEAAMGFDDEPDRR